MRAMPIVIAIILAACTRSVDTASSARPTTNPIVAPTNVTTSGGAGPARASAPVAACSAARPVFTVLPMDPADFRSFRPLGFPQPPIHIFGAKHSSFVINLPGATPTTGRPVRFPSDAIVTDITSTESSEGSGFQIVFAPCRELKSYLFHLGTIAPALKAAFSAATPVCQDFDFGSGGRVRKCDGKLAFAVKAGDAVGGNDKFAGIDWGLVDYRVTLPYANPRRYDGDYPHMASPVDYSAPDVRAVLESKLGSFDGSVRRSVPPIAGAVMQDIAGTAQGNWFAPGGASFMNTTNFEPFLGLLHDHVDPGTPIVSMGTSVRGMSLGLYTYAPRASGTVNRDLKDVRPDGNTYCFDLLPGGRLRSGLNTSTAAGALLLALPTATTLRAELKLGRTCANAPALGPDAFTFER